MQTEHFETIESRVGGQSSKASIARFLPIIFLACVALTGWRYFGPKKSMAAAGWNNDWAAAFQQSKASGKPVVALFTADWCPSCQNFESQVLSDNQIQQYLRDHYTPIVVDLSDRDGPNNARAQELSINVIPSLVLFDQNGQQRARAIGMPADTFYTWLKSNGTVMGPVFGHAN